MQLLKISLLVFILSITISAQNQQWLYIGDEFPGDSVDQNFTDVYLYSPYGMWWISSGNYPEIYRTTEFGVNWETQNFESIINTINYNELNNGILACSFDGKIFIAVDLFSEWELYDSINVKINDVCITYTTNSYDWTAYICGDSGAVCLLTESGITELNTGLDVNFRKVSSRLIDNVWLCGDSLVYYYDGNSFIEKFSAPVSLSSIYYKYPSHIWTVGQSGYIAYSSDNGENWTVQNNPDVLNRSLNDVFFSQIYNWGIGWAVGNEGLILKTTNFGNTWQIEDDGLTENNLNRIDFCHWADFWGGSFGPGIIVGEHKTVLLNPIVVSVDDENPNAKISGFSLGQNYPNPFNPSTKIKYSIPSVTLRQAQSDILVTLKVYDILGKEIATLVNEEPENMKLSLIRLVIPATSGICRAGFIFISSKLVILLKRRR
ncbi:MAG: YCF48-related protein [Ignavibacteriaceae bacterium]|nr:YCF48-related protein [Ignavibacteriaceae bacterium]